MPTRAWVIGCTLLVKAGVDRRVKRHNEAPRGRGARVGRVGHAVCTLCSKIIPSNYTPHAHSARIRHIDSNSPDCATIYQCGPSACRLAHIWFRVLCCLTLAFPFFAHTEATVSLSLHCISREMIQVYASLIRLCASKR